MVHFPLNCKRDCDESLFKIKCIIVSSSVLYVFTQFKLAVDASDVTIYPALFQEHTDNVSRMRKNHFCFYKCCIVYVFLFVSYQFIDRVFDLGDLEAMGVYAKGTPQYNVTNTYSIGFTMINQDSITPQTVHMAQVLNKYKESRTHAMESTFSKPSSLPLYFYFGYQLLQESNLLQDCGHVRCKINLRSGIVKIRLKVI